MMMAGLGLRKEMMMTLSEYSIGELERLVGLTLATTRPAEFVRMGGTVLFRTKEKSSQLGAAVAGDGTIAYAGNDDSAVRRVRSFTDLTEIDPPVAEMRAELERRRSWVDKVVVYLGPDLLSVKKGHLAVVTKDGAANAPDFYPFRVQWDRRVATSQSDGAYGKQHFRIATPEDIKAYEDSLKPKPVVGQVYRHKDTTEADPFCTKDGSNVFLFRARVDGRYDYKTSAGNSWTSTTGDWVTGEVADGKLVPYTEPDRGEDLEGKVFVEDRMPGPYTWRGDTAYYYEAPSTTYCSLKSFRTAIARGTLKECKADPITNATHAGKRVRVMTTDGYVEGIVLNERGKDLVTSGLSTAPGGVSMGIIERLHLCDTSGTLRHVSPTGAELIG